MGTRIMCIECREVFDAGPDACPACNMGTFLYLSGNEDPDFACDELLLVAAFARMGSSNQPQRAQTPWMDSTKYVDERVAISA